MPFSTPSLTCQRRPFLRRAALLAPLMAVLMTACSTTKPALDPESLIPTALTTCSDAPPVPDRPGPGLARTDEVKAGYTADLWAAWKDCKGTVNAVKLRREKLDQQVNGNSFHLPKLSLPWHKTTTPAVTVDKK